jgi:ferredoxin
MSMLRSLSHQDEVHDVVLLHSARTEDEIIFGDQLRELEGKHDGFTFHRQLTGEMGRLKPADLDELCPDWRERETYACGPGELLDAIEERWEGDGAAERLHMERFQPVFGHNGHGEGAGGTIRFTKSDIETESDGDTPILVAGEEAGAELPFGCRMGVCHTCIGKLCAGQIRDLRTGEVSGAEGELVRTCINAAEGPVEIAL